jgi:hypothetical protein
MTSPYGTAIDSELASEVASSQETSRRALTVVSTAAGLATLMGTAIGFATLNRKDVFFPAEALTPLKIAVGAFILAAVLALGVQLPLYARFMDTDDLRNVAEYDWGDSEQVASQQVALARVEVLAIAHKMNTIRSWLLAAAILVEIAAIGATGVMTVRIVDGIPAPHSPANIDEPSK